MRLARSFRWLVLLLACTLSVGTAALAQGDMGGDHTTDVPAAGASDDPVAGNETPEEAGEEDPAFNASADRPSGATILLAALVAVLVIGLLVRRGRSA